MMRLYPWYSYRRYASQFSRGLAAGQQEVREALLNLLADTDLVLVLSGYISLANLVRRPWPGSSSARAWLRYTGRLWSSRMLTSRQSVLARVLLAILVLATPALPVTKSRPNLSGVWKLDRDLTTARYVTDDILVVHQSKQRVKFVYQTDGKVTGTDVFITDGKEMDRYKTRIERAYYRAAWKADQLVIVTQHVLDLFGYQSYKETDRWTLDDNGKTLTQHLSDGKLAVYYYKGPAPEDRSDEIKEFRAVAEFSGRVDGVGDCRFDLSGTLKSAVLGTATYRICLVPEKEAVADSPAHCTPLRGTMKITGEDGVSAFVMKIAGRYCPQEQNFLGSFEVDADRITGTFNQHLTGGSGTLEFSSHTETVTLYGILLFD